MSHYYADHAVALKAELSQAIPRDVLRDFHRKSAAINEFVVSVDRRNRVADLIVEGAALVASDPHQGFYLFRPKVPLEPGATLETIPSGLASHRKRSFARSIGFMACLMFQSGRIRGRSGCTSTAAPGTRAFI